MKEISEKNGFFRTSDLSLVAVLQLQDYRIEMMDRSNPQKIVFIIKQDDVLNELIQAFWSRSLKVEPLAYFESIKSIKARIYQ